MMRAKLIALVYPNVDISDYPVEDGWLLEADLAISQIYREGGLDPEHYLHLQAAQAIILYRRWLTLLEDGVVTL